MGGRGASIGRGSSGAGGSAKGELQLPDGSKIEFDGTLKYGGNDSAVIGNARTSIESFEKKRISAKVEYAISVDKDGNPLGPEQRGGKGSVTVPHSYHDTDGAIFSHIHPRGEGMLGGTFSVDDLKNFANNKNNTVRAAAKEGTYSISKTANFDKAGFSAMVATANADFSSSYRAAMDKIRADVRNGKYTTQLEIDKASAKIFNTALVELHESYLAGQKKYGYKYTLEKTS